MGCCISKCRPEKHSLEDHEFNRNVEDKLVISQAAPPTPTLYSSNKILPSPPSPTSSTSSISSFTCTTSNTISSASSLSTASSSSALSSKDRSFSNEFLWSCYKDNPHITRINSLREATLSLMPTKPRPDQSRKININPSPPKPTFAPIKQSPPQKVVVGSFSMPQKRVRSNSPTNLTRQKSFRKEPVRPITVNSASRTLGSPSPSRRFNGDKCASALATTTILDNSISKRMIHHSPKVSPVHSHCVSSSIRKESVKTASPNNSSRMSHSGLRHREACTLRVGSKIDETLVKDVLPNHDVDSAMMEDIDNPLISLDCFIFL